MKRNSFTLIELLIVIGIIALLAALLLPALSYTKYKAKLVVCMSNVRQVGLTAISYANNNNKWYPYRKNVEDDGYSVPYYLRYGTFENLSDIETFRRLGLEDVQCPFTNRTWSSTTASVSAGYSYYFGWKSYDPTCRMLKVGKTMSFDGKDYDIIASDVLHERPRSGRIIMGHPDYGSNVLSLTGGLWQSTDSAFRGAVDMNFCREDGSAFTISRIKYGDPRVNMIPYENSSDAKTNRKTDYQLLPEKD